MKHRDVTGDHRGTPKKRRTPNAAPERAVSVLVPALNVADTIEPLVSMLRSSDVVAEVVVVDDGSIDGTPRVAEHAGARVVMSTLLGKGASMVDGLRTVGGEIVLFVDGDLTEVHDDLVEKMTRPILEGEADMVKAKFTRDPGRVTLLTARPLLSSFFPELARFEQPLSGIVAARRTVLHNLRFENDYGVDVGMLVDASMKHARIVEVDIGHIGDQDQSLTALGEMATQIARVILDRAWRYDRFTINAVREMEEVERRARAQLLPSAEETTQAKFALLCMDGVLLDGRFVVELAERVGAQWELSRFLDSEVLPDEERATAIASLFAGVNQETFEETARSMPLCPGAVETVVALRRAGYRVGIVTDSFDVAAEIVRRRVFADFRVAHLMRFHHGVATGQVTLSPAMCSEEGCSEHSCCKSNVVRQLHRSAGLDPEQTLAVGDTERDICLLRAVGTPIAFRPQSTIVSEAARYTVTESLTEMLDLLGIEHAGDSAIAQGSDAERTSPAETTEFPI